MASGNPFREDVHRESNDTVASGEDSDFAPQQLSYGPNGEVILPPGQRRGMVIQVPVVGWLLVVQGVFELLFATLFVVMAVLGPEFISQAAQANPTVQDSGFSAEQLKWMTMLVYGAMGLGLLVIAGLSILGGWSLTRFRNHTLGMAACCASFVTIVAGCYCFPTGLCVGTYGLIVLLDGPVKDAFAVGRAGYTSAQIKEIFRALD